jgi:hypothetical protein
MVVACAQDGKYSLAGIKTAFEIAFDSPLKMFNPLKNDTRVAITATSAKSSSSCLFTNYNGNKRSNGAGTASQTYHLMIGSNDGRI